MRRSRAEASDIGWVALGAAVGGGLAFGLLRFALSIWTTAPMGVDLSVNFFWAFVLLTGAVVLGIGGDRAFIEPATWKVVAMGAVGFGVAHAVVTMLNGQRPTELYWSNGLAFLGGVAIAAMLVESKQAWSVGRWMASALTAALVFGLVHALVQQYAPPVSDEGPVREAMQVVRNASFYAAELPRHFDSLASYEFSWFKRLAVADAALAGMALAVGARSGARLVHRSRNRGEGKEPL